MKIKVLQNFGLDGENLAKGQEIDVDEAHFGDNLDSFLEAGYFVEVKPEAEAQSVAASGVRPSPSPSLSAPTMPAAPAVSTVASPPASPAVPASPSPAKSDKPASPDSEKTDAGRDEA